MLTLLVTGGAGFIGTNFIRHALAKDPQCRIVNLDALTYAGNAANLEDLPRPAAERYRFVLGDISDQKTVRSLLEAEEPLWVINFAAESHVDRSIVDPMAFIQTNVVGTCCLLMACRDYWEAKGRPDGFRFLHVSTDEVFGSLGSEGHFQENTPYDPSSPYSASKAASDHLVRAWQRTYDLPVLITNCSNNYGPYQFPEKLIPLMIMNILEGKELPVYGDGGNVRDWLYVIDHCEALLSVLKKGIVGETYCVGGGAERANIQVVEALCSLLDQRLGNAETKSARRLIHFVADRPGHDHRYAINAAKLNQNLGWQPQFGFEDGLAVTVDWYLAHKDWVDSIRSGDYRKWIETNYSYRNA
jgi:dTDP-glucose 4,6-dehydratase